MSKVKITYDHPMAIDERAISKKLLVFIIFTKAGIQSHKSGRDTGVSPVLDLGFAGLTTFGDFCKRITIKVLLKHL